jgi:hypothetical protein
MTLHQDEKKTLYMYEAIDQDIFDQRYLRISVANCFMFLICNSHLTPGWKKSSKNADLTDTAICK